eukprot:2999954-Amphidinium_carterae.1
MEGMEDAFNMAGSQRPERVKNLQNMDDNAKQHFCGLLECCEVQKGGKDFTEVFLRWESQIAPYELQRGRPLADVKVAVVMCHAPGDVKTALRQAAHVIGDDYSRLRDVFVT